jgi:predicted transcriptional regulator
MKQGEGKDMARQMYVEQQMTFDEIAKRVGRSDKTVRTWAEEGEWKTARIELLDQKVKTHEKLHVLVTKLTDRMIADCSGENEISPQSLHALTNLVNAIKGLYVYEGSVKKQIDENRPKDKEGLTDETLAKLEQQMGML